MKSALQKHNSLFQLDFVLFAAELHGGLTIMSCRITNPIFAAELHGGHLLLAWSCPSPTPQAMAVREGANNYF